MRISDLDTLEKSLSVTPIGNPLIVPLPKTVATKKAVNIGTPRVAIQSMGRWAIISNSRTMVLSSDLIAPRLP